ncbi:hypothetical protein EYF80_029044 [Liparis tanakae]|uniref:Uncharacterized protein n=1 Tax=Liparis tanakae TaxID=230148 RepID=A0A4Z2H5D8_9TELE|nr:hypothetical protein EYF80_029044 [Liparis tanakae]
MKPSGAETETGPENMSQRRNRARCGSFKPGLLCLHFPPPPLGGGVNEDGRTENHQLSSGEKHERWEPDPPPLPPHQLQHHAPPRLDHRRLANTEPAGCGGGVVEGGRGTGGSRHFWSFTIIPEQRPAEGQTGRTRTRRSPPGAEAFVTAHPEFGFHPETCTQM